MLGIFSKYTDTTHSYFGTSEVWKISAGASTFLFVSVHEESKPQVHLVHFMCSFEPQNSGLHMGIFKYHIHLSFTRLFPAHFHCKTFHLLTQKRENTQSNLSKIQDLQMTVSDQNKKQNSHQLKKIMVCLFSPQQGVLLDNISICTYLIQRFAVWGGL